MQSLHSRVSGKKWVARCRNLTPIDIFISKILNVKLDFQFTIYSNKKPEKTLQSYVQKNKQSQRRSLYINTKWSDWEALSRTTNTPDAGTPCFLSDWVVAVALPLFVASLVLKLLSPLV
jgi:hypothetical protein